MKTKNTLKLSVFMGLNASADPSKIEDGQFVKLSGFYQNSSRHELIRVEPYNTLAGTAAVKWMGVYGIKGAFPYNLHVFGVTGFTNIIQTYRQGSVVLSAAQTYYGNIRDGVQYNDNYYFLSTDGIIVVTPATAFPVTAAVTAGTPPVEFGIIFKERLFAKKFGVYDTIVYSDPGNPISFPGANVFKVRPGDGQDITAIIPISSDKLLIFKTSSIYALYILGDDPTTWQLKLISSEYGAIGPDAVDYFENYIYFVSRSGPCMTDGVDVAYIGSDLPKADYDSNYYLNAIYDIHTYILNRHFMFMRGNVGQTLAYNVDTKQWSYWYDTKNQLTWVKTGYFTDIRQFNTAESFDYVGAVIYDFGSTGNHYSGSGYITYKEGENYGNFPGYLIPPSELLTKIYDVDAPDTFKRWMYADITVIGAGTYTFRTYDEKGVASVTQTSTVTTATAPTTIRFKVGRYTKALQIYLSHTKTDNNPVKILQMVVEYGMKDLTAKTKSNA